MTLPRPIGLDETVMFQKRCYRGEFRLRPEPVVNQIFEYSLAYCAHKYEIDLHEFEVLSNHPHVLLTDLFGKRPEFLQLLLSMVARATNQHFGEGDAVFSSQRYSAPVLLDEQTVYEKILYVLNNAVSAGIVRRPVDWEGVTSWSLEYDRPKIIKRPDGFFSDDMPETVELVIRRPPNVRPELDDRALRRSIRKDAEEQAKAIVREVKAEGRVFIGMKRARTFARDYTPRTRMSSGGRRSGIRPHFAGKDAALREALAGLQQFWADHRLAMRRYEDGDVNTEFPVGTYKMRLQYGVRIAAPPTAPP